MGEPLCGGHLQSYDGVEGRVRGYDARRNNSPLVVQAAAQVREAAALPSSLKTETRP